MASVRYGGVAREMVRGGRVCATIKGVVHDNDTLAQDVVETVIE